MIRCMTASGAHGSPASLAIEGNFLCGDAVFLQIIHASCLPGALASSEYHYGGLEYIVRLMASTAKCGVCHEQPSKYKCPTCELQ